MSAFLQDDWMNQEVAHGDEWPEADVFGASGMEPMNEAWATGFGRPVGQGGNSSFSMTTKIPPAYDGRRLWFAYEEEVDEWCDVSELPEEKRGPALRSRLEGDAAVYKQMLDRDLLKDPTDGVNYFKSTIRPYFVKCTSSVFLWRFMQVVNYKRGHHDMLRWMGRFAVLRKRMQDAWMGFLVLATQMIRRFNRNNRESG